MKRIYLVITSLLFISGFLYFLLGCNSSQENQLAFGDLENVIFRQSDPEKIFVDRYADNDKHFKIIDPWTMKEDAIVNLDGYLMIDHVTLVDEDYALLITKLWRYDVRNVVNVLLKMDLKTGKVLASIEANARTSYSLKSFAHCSDFVYIPVFKKSINQWRIFKLRMDDLGLVDKLSFPKGKGIWYFLDYALNSNGTKLYLLSSYRNDEDDKKNKQYQVQVYETSGFKLVDEIDVGEETSRLKLSSQGLLYVYPRHGSMGTLKIYDTKNENPAIEIDIPEKEIVSWLDDSVPDNKLFFLTNIFTPGIGIDPTQAKIYEIDLTDFSTVIYPVNATLKAYKPKSFFLFEARRSIMPTLAFKKKDRIRVCFVENIYSTGSIFHSSSSKDTIHYYDVELN